MADTSIKINGNIYPVQSSRGIISENLLSGFLFRIIDRKSEEIIGCLSCYISATVRAIWNNNWINKQITEDSLFNLFITILPHIDLPTDIDIIKQRYPSCIKIIITSQDSGYDPKNFSFNIRGQDNPECLVKELIYKDEIEDSKIEKEILNILSEHWKQSYNTNILVNNLEERLFIPQKVFLRNLDYLIQEGLIKANKDASQNWVSVGISNKGLNYVRNNFTAVNGKYQLIKGDVISGDKITAKTTGNNSPLIIKSQNINIAFEEIKAEVKTTSTLNKQEIIVLLNQLKQEMTQKNDPRKVKGLLEEIKKKGSWVNEKILSHPLLAQLIAQALAKVTGIL